MRLVFKRLFSILLICCLFPISAIAVQASEQLNETNTVGETVVSIVLCQVSVAADKEISAAGYKVTVNGKPYTGDISAVPIGSIVEIKMNSLPKGKKLNVTINGATIIELSDGSVVLKVDEVNCTVSLSLVGAESGNSSSGSEYNNNVNNNVSNTDNTDNNGDKKSSGKTNKGKGDKSKPSLINPLGNDKSKLPYSQHPNTGENGGIPYWVAVMLITSAGLIADTYLRKRRRKG